MEKVDKIKSIYKELELEKVYQEYEESSFQRISKLIDSMDDTLLPKSMFYDFMNRIYKRSV